MQSTVAVPRTYGRFQDLENKRVLITGGSAGIGRAAALAFADNGAQVAIMGRRQDRLDAVIRMLPQQQKGHAIVGDLLNIEQCKATVLEAVERMGGLDILVHSGATKNEGMEEAELPFQYAWFMQLHVISAAALLDAAIPQLIDNRGCVINVSSLASTAPSPSTEAYAAAKAALDAATRNWALKYAQYGVRVNSILPGVVITEEFEREAGESGERLEVAMARASLQHPTGRLSTPEEQADTILFLASQASSFVTGVNLSTDGGAHLGRWMNLDYVNETNIPEALGMDDAEEEEEEGEEEEEEEEEDERRGKPIGAAGSGWQGALQQVEDDEEEPAFSPADDDAVVAPQLEGAFDETEDLDFDDDLDDVDLVDDIDEDPEEENDSLWGGQTGQAAGAASRFQRTQPGRL